MRNWFGLAKNVLIGRARNLSDASLFQKTSLVALLAWVGLGADGLSSSCYGPEAAYVALHNHTFLSLFRGGGFSAHHRGHLRELFADHRTVPVRRRRLSRREQIVVADGGRRFRAARSLVIMC
jgi:hypothetical protein